MIYLDNSATTSPSEKAIEKMNVALQAAWGNPSSLHGKGIEAEAMMREAVRNILASFSIRNPDSMENRKRLIFTGSGTEADNLAVFGTALAKKSNVGGRIITSDSEHPAILECCHELEKRGFDVVYVPTRNGVFDLDFFEKSLNDKTFLVTVMAVNNETGAQYDLKSIFGIAKRFNPDIVTHTDAVQGYTHIDFKPDLIGADMVTVSAHKIHGPKGIGALLVNPEILKRKRLVPYIFGGGQENGFRSGTENLPGIVGFGAAAVDFMPQSVLRRAADFAALRKYLVVRLPDGVRVNQPNGAYAPHIVSLTLPDIKSETMLHFLSEREIYVSSGSACSSHGKHQSHVLSGFGLNSHDSDCTIRVSFGDDTTEKMLDTFISALTEGCERLVKIR